MLNVRVLKVMLDSDVKYRSSWVERAGLPSAAYMAAHASARNIEALLTKSAARPYTSTKGSA